jgi:putative peptide maturation dehydrogenase
MRLTRPDVLMFERRDVRADPLADMLAGSLGATRRPAWIALAPHLGREVDVDAGDLPVFGELVAGEPVSAESLRTRFGEARVDRLVADGLLVSDAPDHAALRARIASLRGAGWWSPALVAQAFGRWEGVDIAADEARSGRQSLARLLAGNGPPPPATHDSPGAACAIALPAPARTPLDALLNARSTCRNFDAAATLPLADLASLLHRVFGAQSTRDLADGVAMLKKNSPSGGGLHPVEAFVLAQRVAGLAPGAYHYQPVAHALVAMPAPDGVAEPVAAIAHQLVAGQAWFANAPALVILVARFRRNFWKYPRHPKAWRVVHLDAGHLSQLFYLGATELGHGAFVTGAINDAAIERLLGLDGLEMGALAICGLGPRAVVRTHFEFDGRAAGNGD